MKTLQGYFADAVMYVKPWLPSEFSIIIHIKQFQCVSKLVKQRSALVGVVPPMFNSVDALALSSLLTEGCIMPFDSYEIKWTQPRCEQVFIYEALHFDGTNIQKWWKALSVFSLNKISFHAGLATYWPGVRKNNLWTQLKPLGWKIFISSP